MSVSRKKQRLSDADVVNLAGELTDREVRRIFRKVCPQFSLTVLNAKYKREEDYCAACPQHAKCHPKLMKWTRHYLSKKKVVE